MSYPVVTRTSLPSFSAQEVTVRRRFKDMVALAELLSVSALRARTPAHFCHCLIRNMLHISNALKALC